EWWRLCVGRLEDWRYYVDDVVELRAKFSPGLDALWPADRQPIPRSAEVRRDLLGPLERGVHCVSPANRIVVVSLIATQFVDHRHEELNRLGSKLCGNLVGRPVHRAFSAGAVV